MLEVISNNLVVDGKGERITVNLDQVRMYMFREEGRRGSQILSDISQIPDRPSLLFFLLQIFLETIGSLMDIFCAKKSHAEVPAKSYGSK